MYQYIRVLNYLKDKKVATTDELRQMATNQGHPIVDIPKCVSTLVDKGYPITSKRNHNGSATYTLGKMPEVKLPEYVAIGNTLYKKEDLKPEQQVLI